MIGAVSGGSLAVLAVAIVLLAGLGLRLTRYRLGRHEFEVLVGNVVIRRVYLKDIEQVSVGGSFPCEFWPSHTWRGGGLLTIRRKRGLLRHLTVTPSDPGQMRVNLYYALGWEP